MSTLLLSDLHLPDEPSPLREGFLRFLSGPARDARAVYLLGDLFEVWIGDDIGLSRHAAEVSALRALSDAGVAVYFMHGNRDFLIGRRFVSATGMRLLHDPVMIDLEGTPTLLGHGDIWCTDDLPYQRWRRFSRNRFAQWLFARLSPERRRRIAGDLRGKSDQGKRMKTAAIMDVNAEAIAQAFQNAGVTRMIHGHTHRPDTHRLEIDGRIVERVVLADWRPGRMEYLEVTGSQLRRCLLT